MEWGEQNVVHVNTRTHTHILCVLLGGRGLAILVQTMVSEYMGLEALQRLSMEQFKRR